MNCQVQKYKSYDMPTFAGNFRFLLGLTLMFAGIYIAMLTDIKGHGLGWLLIFAAPFVFFKDND